MSRYFSKFALLGLLHFITFNGNSQTKELGEFIAVDNLGNSYNLSELILDSNRGMMAVSTGCSAGGNFNIYAQIGSGFEDQNDPVHQARLEVLCAVLSDFTQTFYGDGASINIVLRPFNQALTLVDMTHYGTSFYVIPQNAILGLDYSVNDSELWKTYNSTSDSYGFMDYNLDLASPLGAQMAHGAMAFDFAAFNYHYDLGSIPSLGYKDFYSAVLQSVLRMFGFNSLDNLTGGSLIDNNLEYFSRWDRLVVGNNSGQMILPDVTGVLVPQEDYNPASAVGMNCSMNHALQVSNLSAPLYTPMTYGLKTISTFATNCSNNPLVNEYAASNTLPPINSIMRAPASLEVLALNELDYSVNANFGSPLHLNSINYNISAPIFHCVGHTDSYTSNWNLLLSNATPIQEILGSDLLTNDHHATTYTNLEVVYGNLQITGPTTGTSESQIAINLSIGEVGVQILRYIPFNQFENKYGNVTYVVLYAGNFLFTPDGNIDFGSCTGCNIVGNNSLEPYEAGCIVLNSWDSDEMECWETYTSTPDIVLEGVTCNGFAADPYLDGDGVADHFIALRANYEELWEESIKQPLDRIFYPGEYTLHFMYRTMGQLELKLAYSSNFLSYNNILQYSQTPTVTDHTLGSYLVPEGSSNWESGSISFTVEPEDVSLYIAYLCFGAVSVQTDETIIWIDDISLVSTSPALQANITVNGCAGELLNLETATQLTDVTFYDNGIPIDPIIDLNNYVSGYDQIVADIDNEYCDANPTVTLNISAYQELIVAVSTLDFCTGDEVTLTTSGVGPFVWYIDGLLFEGNTTNSITIVTMNSSFYYHVEHVSNECIYGNGEIMSSGYSTILSSDDDFSVCGSGPIVLQISPAPISVQWTYVDIFDNTFTSSSQSLSISSSGQVAVIAEGINTDGCGFILHQLIDFKALPVIEVNVQQPILCDHNIDDGEVFNVTALGATSYSWYDSSGNTVNATPTFLTTIEGTYQVVGSIGNCEASASFELTTIETGYVVPVFEQNAGLCPNASLVVTFDDIHQVVNWNPLEFVTPSSDQFSAQIGPISETTTFNYKVLYDNGCFSEESMIIEYVPFPEFVDFGEFSVCTGGTADLLAQYEANYQYAWYDTDNNLLGEEFQLSIPDVMTAIELNLQVTNQELCSADFPVHISIDDEDAPTLIIQSNDADCLGSGQICIEIQTIDNQIGVTINGQLGMIGCNPVEAGVYHIETIDHFGCMASADVEIGAIINTVSASVNYTFNPCSNVQDVCVTTIGGVQPYDLFIDDELYAMNCFQLSPGVHDLEVIDNNGCSYIEAITIEGIGDLLSASINLQPSSCMDQFNACVVATGGTMPYSYSFNNGVLSNSSCSVVSGNTYTVTVIDALGCTSEMSEALPTTPNYYPANVVISNQTQLANYFDGVDAISFGADLTFSGTNIFLIEDVDFYMGIASDIFIEPGTIVEFRNCLFTSCDSHWQGFKVQSNPNNNSIPIDDVRGTLVFSDQNAPCRVEYAVTAIKTGGALGAQGNLRSAGLIQCTNAEFYNCKTAADFRNSNVKLSYFRLCTFDIDDNFVTRFGDSPFMRHIWCDKTKYLKISGCQFSNNNTQVTQWSNRKVGIYAHNSPIIIEAYSATLNDPGVPSTFIGFNEGVKAFTWIGQYNGIIIRDSEFTRNRRAIHCSNTCYHYINRNTISVGEPTGLQVLDEQEVVYVGIYQNGGAQFEIMENEITGFITAIPDNLDPVMPFTVGICVARTKTTDDEIYRNFLNSLNYGNVANGDNGEGNAGLRYVCNENTNNHFDFVVSDNFMWLAEADIAGLQLDLAEGDFIPNQSAANTFISNADNNSLEKQNFWNEGNGLVYHRFDGNSLENPEEIFGVQVSSDETVENICESETERTVSIDGSIDNIEYNHFLILSASTKTNWQNAQYLYTLLIDGGDTQALQEQVEFAWTNNTWEMRNDLLAKSPYLSLDVLYTVADKTVVFPNAIALEIFMANPDVLKDNRFIRYLESKTNPMPEYMIDILQSASDQTTMRAILEENLSYARSTCVEAMAIVMRTKMQDPTYNWENFTSDLKATKTFPTELLVIEEYLQRGLITEAWDHYNAMPANGVFSVYDKREFSSFELWIEFRTQMVQDGLDFDNLPQSQITKLQLIADDHWNSYAGRNAMEILNLFYDGQYDIDPMISSGVKASKRTGLAATPALTVLRVYPNPANEYVLVEVSQEHFKSVQSIAVVDSNGKEVYHTALTHATQQVKVEVGQWAAGPYQISLLHNNRVIESTTVHVVH